MDFRRRNGWRMVLNFLSKSCDQSRCTPVFSTRNPRRGPAFTWWSRCLRVHVADPDENDRGRTLMDHLKRKNNTVNWYYFGKQMTDPRLEYIRTLSETPFDPIAQTDAIDAKIQQKAWEEPGVLFSTVPDVALIVREGAVPSPIIDDVMSMYKRTISNGGAALACA